MNKIISLFLTIVFVILIVSCDHTDPERKIINDRLHIITLQGEVALMEINHLYKENGEVVILGDDEVIVKKNFVAYALYDDTVVLCEEKKGTQIFWTYEIKTEVLSEHTSYSNLCDFLSYNDFEWENLWVAEFEIK